jgi:hypothetical protein
MMLSWAIRYLDKAGKRITNRTLYLQTQSLEPTLRAAVELVVESKTRRTEQDILKFRHLFVECSPEEAGIDLNNADSFNSICLRLF